MASFWVAYRLGAHSWRFWHLAIGRDRRYSTSLFQSLAWTVVVLGAYLALWFARVRLGITAAPGPVPQNVLAAMGLSLGTTVTAAGITGRNVRSGRDVRLRAKPGELTLGHLIRDDLGRPNLAKAQLMAWTAVAIGIFVVSSVDAVSRTMAAASASAMPPLPDIEPTLLLLMGIGQGAYLAIKAVSSPDGSEAVDAAASSPGDAAVEPEASPAASTPGDGAHATGSGAAATAAHTAADPGSARVPGFTPSVNGLHFVNAWPHEPDLVLTLPGVGRLPIGDASNGVCGGMAYAVRDVFQTPGLAPVAATANPGPDEPLYHYIVTRLLESFDIPHLGFARYYEWMLTPDGDETLGPVHVRRGIAWKTIVEEWAGRIRPELDAGHLVCLGLVTVAGSDPRLLGENHQVLAWGYDVTTDGLLTLRIYDPNTPQEHADHAAITLSVLHPELATPITHNLAIDRPVRGFFRMGYTYQDPTGQLG
jgi:hypothetical protein